MAFGRAKPTKYATPRALTSAAAPVRLRNKSELETLRNRNALSHAWQMEAWRVYDAIGEVSYAFNLIANAMARIRIHAAVVMHPDEPPTEATDASNLELPGGGEVGPPGGIDPRLAQKAQEYLGKLNGGGGLSALLRAYALNKQVAGECYLCLIDGKWSIKSTFEIVVDPGGVMRAQPSATTMNAQPKELPPKSMVYRMWTAHPRFSADPDCSVRPVLFLCEQLILLNRMINNTVRSRMNAGILKVAASIIAASRTPGTEGNVDDNGVEELSPFEVDLHAVMTQPVQDDQAGAAVIPMVAVVPDELVQTGIEWMSLARDVDEHMLKQAENVLLRILQGLAIPKDLITGYSAVRFCVDDTTEALTRAGWRKRTELAVGDEILALDHETGFSSWQPITAMNVFDVTDEPMLSMESSSHSSLTTGAHRWPTVKVGKKVGGSRRRWATSTEGFSQTDTVAVSAEPVDLPSEAKYTDDFVRLIALYTSDGCRVDPPRGRPWISVGKSATADVTQISAIRAILTRLYGPAVRGQGVNRAAWNEYLDEKQQRIMFRLNVDASEDVFGLVPDRSKAVPLEFVHALTRSQLDLYLESFVELGDGCRRGRGAIQTYQTDPRRLDSLAMAGVLSGRVVKWSGTVPGREITTRKGTIHTQDSVRLYISKARPTFRPWHTKQEWVTYTGVVWCPTTPLGTWLARRDGKVFFTGNSNAQQVSEDVFKQSVEPLALAFVDDITDIYLRPLLRADAEVEGWDLEQVEKVVAWYDPSEVATRPDRGADADAGWDRGALSDDAWRRAHGFSVEDAPTEDEQLQRTLLRGAVIPPNLVDYMARELLPQYFKGAPPLVTKTQAGMSEADAATTPLQKAHQPPAAQPRVNPANSYGQNPAGSNDQNLPPGGTLPPRTP